MVKATAPTEEAKPANVQVVQIMYSGCNECSGLSYVIDALKQQNVNITEQALDHMLSDEAKSIVSKYGIKKLPALVITGEINKPLLAPFWNKIGADVRRDSIVYETPNPPYYNVLLNKISGNVKITILKDSSCQDCFDIIGFADYLKTAVYSSDTTILEYNSSEGNDFVKQYNISRIPSVILSQEFGIYPIADAWPTVGTAEDDGNYVLRNTQPPYLNLTNGKIIGRVSVTGLVDSNCAECFDISLFDQVFAQFGLNTSKKTIYTISSVNGKALISKYNITQVPATILSSETSAYESLAKVWDQVGTVEKDGSYVFRNVSILGVTYKDLKTNATVKGTVE